METARIGAVPVGGRKTRALALRDACWLTSRWAWKLEAEAMARGTRVDLTASEHLANCRATRGDRCPATNSTAMSRIPSWNARRGRPRSGFVVQPRGHHGPHDLVAPLHGGSAAEFRAPPGIV